MTGKTLRLMRKAARGRDRRPITVQEAANRLGIHYNTLMKYERGDNPIPRCIARLAIYELRNIDLGLVDPESDP
jgi:transcriptional regulator with XRE-family HTH domain